MYKLIKKPFFGPYMVKWKNPLTENEKMNWKQYIIKSKSNSEITGLFANGKNKIKGTIVLGHPMVKPAKGYFLKNGYTEILRENGYNVFVFDFNGFGESKTGNFSFFYDIIAVGNKVKEIAPNLPIGYHGISLGAMWSIIAFTEKNSPYNSAIIESAPTTLDEYWVKYPFAYKILKTMNYIFPKYKKKINMLERFSEIQNLKSILLIYSKKDEITPISMAKKFMNKSIIPIELYTVDNANHANIIGSSYKKEYLDKIINYFNNQLK
jgi:fermentation-respiration switch protein FrsA (DUF1100 family)